MAGMYDPKKSGGHPSKSMKPNYGPSTAGKKKAGPPAPEKKRMSVRDVAIDVVTGREAIKAVGNAAKGAMSAGKFAAKVAGFGDKPKASAKAREYGSKLSKERMQIAAKKAAEKKRKASDKIGRK